MASLGPQRMLSQLGRMGRDGAATGPLCLYAAYSGPES